MDCLSQSWTSTLNRCSTWSNRIITWWKLRASWTCSITKASFKMTQEFQFWRLKSKNLRKVSWTRNNFSNWSIEMLPKLKTCCSSKKSFQNLMSSSNQSELSTKSAKSTKVDSWLIIFLNLPMLTLKILACQFVQSMVRDSILESQARILLSNRLQVHSITASLVSSKVQTLFIGT